MCQPASRMALLLKSDLSPYQVFPFPASLHHACMKYLLSCSIPLHDYNNMRQISLNTLLLNHVVSTSQNRPLTACIFQQAHSFLQASPQEIPLEVQD